MMSVIPSLLLAAGPCADPALLAARLATPTSEAEFAQQLADAEDALGARLLLLDELARPLGDRAALASVRAGSACAWVTGSASEAEVPLAPLRAVLDRPAFSAARDRAPHAVNQAWGRLKDWVLSLLEDRATRSLASGVRWLVLGLAGTLASVGVWRALVRRRARAGEAGRAPAPVVLSHLSAPPDHLRAARALLPADPRGALREGLLALLSALERAERLDAGRTRTNRELAAALADRPGEAGAGLLLRGFDRRYYSLQRVSPEDAEGYLASVEATCARIGREAG